MIKPLVPLLLMSAFVLTAQAGERQDTALRMSSTIQAQHGNGRNERPSFEGRGHVRSADPESEPSAYAPAHRGSPWFLIGLFTAVTGAGACWHWHRPNVSAARRLRQLYRQSQRELRSAPADMPDTLYATLSLPFLIRHIKADVDLEAVSSDSLTLTIYRWNGASS